MPQDKKTDKKNTRASASSAKPKKQDAVQAEKAFDAVDRKRQQEKAKQSAKRREKSRKVQKQRSKETKKAKEPKVETAPAKAKRGINSTGGLLMAIGIIGLAVCGYMFYIHETIAAAIALICASLPLGYLIAVAASNARVRAGKDSIYKELLIVFGGLQLGAAFGTFVYWSSHTLGVAAVCMAGIALVGAVAAFVANSEMR